MIAVVIPCYKVRGHILGVIARIGPEVGAIYVVDDFCPEGSGDFVQAHCQDSRVCVLRHSVNQGVGGAMITGYQRAAADGATVIVKIDGDGQMDPSDIDRFVRPILAGRADYTKGNRFFDIEFLASMPPLRIFGNAVLSFVSKISSGYWNVMDPTNGYTAIHGSLIKYLPMNKIDRRYFFESDMLFRLNVLRAVVVDIPMESVYGNEVSNLNIKKVALEFPGKYLSRFVKRLFYSYFLRDFNFGSVELLFGLLLVVVGAGFGFWHWHLSVLAGISATSGQVMLAALPILVGIQLLVSAIGYDISSVPKDPVHNALPSVFGKNLSPLARDEDALTLGER
ncbi:glycosyl transferase family 2 [Cupriavidus necator]|uniref:glycosyltransferase family 2 protein n=1 Tax=Cupriavidus necator TaxID=106590 RepID=UPI0007354535|nr:glycosyltransferase family 2 protein [Cupriavidus necator]KUE90269.1 glycosyl transferase family 2 [Cupriavidus necator]